MLGISVMLWMLCGNDESASVAQRAIGLTITKLVLGDDDALHFGFEGGFGMKVSDQGQSCCETRYMRTDDDLSSFVGSKLLGLLIKQAPNEQAEYDEHEVQFLEVQTDRGCFTMASHNEHNGYYGGFDVRCSEEAAS